MPGPADEEVLDDATLRKEDFVWSEHEFNDGPKEPLRVMRDRDRLHLKTWSSMCFVDSHCNAKTGATECWHPVGRSGGRES